MDFTWRIDPLPVPPAGVVYGTMDWWRWYSALVLDARRTA